MNTPNPVNHCMHVAEFYAWKRSNVFRDVSTRKLYQKLIVFYHNHATIGEARFY